MLQQLFSPSVQHTLDVVGIFVFAISCALLAVRKNFDVFGIAVLAVSSVHPLNLLAVSLASAALLGVMLRLLLTFRQYMAMVRVSRSEALSDSLGDAAPRVTTFDRDRFYTRPEAVLAAYDATVRAALRGGAPAVRVFGELPLCRTQEQADTWTRYEAILNRAFEHHPVRLLCGYDAGEDRPVVGQVRRRRQPMSASSHTQERNHDGHPRDMDDEPGDGVEADGAGDAGSVTSGRD